MRGDDSKANIVGMAETAKCLVMLERDLSQADAMLMEADSLAQRRQFAHPAIAAGNGMLRLHELMSATGCYLDATVSNWRKCQA